MTAAVCYPHSVVARMSPSPPTASLLVPKLHPEFPVEPLLHCSVRLGHQLHNVRRLQYEVALYIGPVGGFVLQGRSGGGDERRICL